MTRQHDKRKVYSVQPLRKQSEIEAMRQALANQGRGVTMKHRTGQRNKTLFDFGCHTGLRVSDIVGLKVEDVAKTDSWQTGKVTADMFKRHLARREKKTGKVSRAYINDHLAKELAAYVNFMKLEPGDYLFPSRKGKGPLSTTQVYRFLVAAGEAFGQHNIGTHTMRKTFGYQYYKHGGRIEDLQKILNHSTPAITRRYIGIEQDHLDNTLKNLNF